MLAVYNSFQLLWVVLIGLVFALIIQYLAANLGVSTGKHLSELCKAEYPKLVKYYLWLLAEIAVIVADIPDGLLHANRTQGQYKYT
ncbi:metal transporter Nramp5-like [Gossypium australe]|uniref:Metal transporter Nramp5-like n=1 Tax=Gossypium australe TaxID=47621 RepID=A0A5B6VT71_9ROSI|nr:metal transporter Nramp5-like [Gossypium australe]